MNIDFDKVTQVTANGKQYQVVDKSEQIDNPEGKCLLLCLPLVDGLDAPTDKRPNGFKYYARIGSKWGGKPLGHNGLRVDFYPLPKGVTKSKTETALI
jgi:hypothetical protein